MTRNALLALAVALAATSLMNTAAVADTAADGSFVLANVAPPEPEPPAAAPEAAPETPAPPETPAETAPPTDQPLPEAPETPAESTTPEPLPPADTTSAPSGMGGAWIGILAAIAVAAIAGFWLMRRK